MALRKKTKLMMMFAPIILGFILAGIAIDDLKHPQVTQDSCVLAGRGLSIQPFRRTARELYSQGGPPEQDIAFQCRSFGPVVINDLIPFALNPDKPVALIEKRFHYLPTRYSVSLNILNDNIKQ